MSSKIYQNGIPDFVGNVFCAILAGAMLICGWQSTSAQEGGIAKSIITDWSTRSNSVVGVQAIDYRQAVFAVSSSSAFSNSVRVLAFKTSGGKIWVGPEMQFYAEADSGLFGGSVFPRVIVWQKSLAPQAETNLDAAIRHFNKQTSGMDLFDPPIEFRGDTDMDIMPFDFYTIREHDSAAPRVIEVRSVEVRNDEVTISLVNSVTSSNAVVTINLNDKRLTKAVLNGKQIFP